MARKLGPDKSKRGTPIELPEWWLEAAKIRIGHRRNAKAAAEISAAVGREPPWDRTTLGNFLKNEHATQELLDAICRTYDGLPHLVFLARSLDEANALEAISQKYTERDQRGVHVDLATSRMENAVAPAIGSSDGNGVKHGERAGARRSGGVVQSRPASRRARS